jgi:hypothetical protein
MEKGFLREMRWGVKEREIKGKVFSAVGAAAHHMSIRVFFWRRAFSVPPDLFDALKMILVCSCAL